MLEMGVLHHNGRAFSARGASVSPAGELSAYVHATPAGYALRTWDGRATLLSVSSSRWDGVAAYRPESWGKTEAVAIRLTTPRRRDRGRDEGRWIVGYSLGLGMLFRGAYFVGSEADARSLARSVAESWLERDAELDEPDDDDPADWNAYDVPDDREWSE